MWETIQQFGFAGAFVLVFLYIFFKEVLPIILRNKTAEQGVPVIAASLDSETKKIIYDLKRQVDGIETNVNKIEDQVDDLFKAHCSTAAIDNDGAYRWWNKESTGKALEETLKEILLQMQKETGVLKKLAERVASLTLIAP